MSESCLLQPRDAAPQPLVHWTPARFLLVGGTVLIVLGLCGVLRMSGLLSRADLFNPPQWINWLHLSVGAAAVLVALKGNADVQRGIACVPAALGSTLGIAGLALSLHAGHGSASEGLDLRSPSPTSASVRRLPGLFGIQGHGSLDLARLLGYLALRCIMILPWNSTANYSREASIF